MWNQQSRNWQKSSKHVDGEGQYLFLVKPKFTFFWGGGNNIPNCVHLVVWILEGVNDLFLDYGSCSIGVKKVKAEQQWILNEFLYVADVCGRAHSLIQSICKCEFSSIRLLV